MKVKLLSDLHLEFGGFDPGEGDVLILAGDIINVKELRQQSPQGKYYKEFLEKCANNYNKVFYVCGNHEYYFNHLDKTHKHLLEVTDVEGSTITVLNNSVETYEGVNFIGATMWTNYDNENYDKMKLGLDAMTDYHVIEEGEESTKLLPSSTVREHNKTIEYLENTLPTLTGETVVITHHAPHATSLSGDYVGNELAAAYHSDLEDFILKHGPEYWCHGHIHHTNDYYVGSTRILSNPRGYAKYNENPDFNKEFEFEVGVPVKEVAQEVPVEA